MTFLWAIQSALLNVSEFFWNIYLETRDWVSPFDLIAIPFYYASEAFLSMTQSWTSFIAWVEYVADRVATILSEGDIWGLLTLPIEWAQAAWNWVVDAFQNVWNIVTDWWEITKTTVQYWIDIAVEGFNELKVAWNNFWTATFPNLIDNLKLENWWIGKLFAVDGLIGSKLAEWFPFYDELVLSMEGILTFFSDPAKAVYELFDYIIDRFWEDTE